MKIITGTFILVLFITNIYGQNLYKDYNLNDTLKGEKLTIGTGNIGYLHSSEFGSSFNLNLNAIYTKWKFNPTDLYYLQANLYSNYYRTNYNDPSVETREQNSRNDYEYNLDNLIYTGIGGSHYFSPKKFYLSGAVSAELRTLNTNYYDENGYTRLNGQGFLWTGIGYGRIDNAIGLEQALTASESLLKHKIINSKLSDKSLQEIDHKLSEFRNGNYLDKYLDDASIILMKDIEAILLKNNEINKSLDAENSVRLFQTLMNTSRRYYYYPRYIGAQLEAQLQTHVFSNEKPKENYLKFSGVYGYPASEKTNILFSAAYKIKLNNDARGYFSWFPNYYSYYGNIGDYNNIKFNNHYSGLGVFAGGDHTNLNDHKSQLSISIDATHSLNSTTGLKFNAEYHYYPANKDIEYFYDPYYYYNPAINEYYYDIYAQLDYNIYSRLFSHFRTGYGKSNYRDGFSINLDFEYVIF